MISRVFQNIGAVQYMPSNRYHGFAIGQESWHQSLWIRAGGGWELCSVGSPIKLDVPFRGEPEVRPWRPTYEQIATGELTAGEPSTPIRSVAHVLGFQEPGDIFYAPARRAQYSRQTEVAYSDTAGANGPIYVMPFQGRRHGAFYVQRVATTIEAPQIVGVRYGDAEDATVLAYTNVIGVADGANKRDRFPFTAEADQTSNFVIHVGGTDNEEGFDEVMFVCGDGVTNQSLTITAAAWGELGA